MKEGEGENCRNCSYDALSLGWREKSGKRCVSERPQHEDAWVVVKRCELELGGT